MKVIEIKEEKELKTLTTDPDKLVVIDCSATWCGPCKTFGKFYDKFVTQDLPDISNRVTFCKLDIDNMEEFCTNNNITSVPTILFIRNNAVLETLVGSSPVKFRQTFDKYIVKPTATTNTAAATTGPSST